MASPTPNPNRSPLGAAPPVQHAPRSAGDRSPHLSAPQPLHTGDGPGAPVDTGDGAEAATISATRTDAGVLVTFAGEVDLACLDAVLDLRRVLACGPTPGATSGRVCGAVPSVHPVSVDASCITFIDIAGLACLLLMVEAGEEVRVLRPSRAVSHLLDLLRLAGDGRIRGLSDGDEQAGGETFVLQAPMTGEARHRLLAWPGGASHLAAGDHHAARGAGDPPASRSSQP